MFDVRFLIMFLAGMTGAILANRSIAVFNDALRPIMPEYREGRMSRWELATTSFALSFGLIVGFGIPFSILSPILLIHSLWLGTDIIGVAFPAPIEQKWYHSRKGWLGFVGSGLAGGMYGVLLLVGLQWFVDVMGSMPVNIVTALDEIGTPVLYAFIAFPALTVAYEYGFINGAITLLLMVVARVVAASMGSAGAADGWALMIGLIVMIIYAMREKAGENSGLSSLFADRAKNIRRNIPYIAIAGALYGWGCHEQLVTSGPLALIALKDQHLADAINITIVGAFSFIPLKGMTSLATGTFVTDGFGFVATVGLLAGNWWIALLGGALVMSLEAMSLVWLADFLDKYPGIKKSAENMRGAMGKLLEMGLLVGSVNAAQAMMPGTGVILLAGIYLLNETAKRPVVRMAVGPVAAIAVGIIANVLAVLGFK